MIVSGKFFADDLGDRYLAAAFDRMRDERFQRERHPPYQRRIWNRRLNAYGKGEHATQVWTRWIGRVRIARRPA